MLSSQKTLTCELARGVAAAIAPSKVVVRINRCDGGPNWMRGFLLGANGTRVEVQPFGHKKSEFIDADSIRISTGHNSPEVLAKIDAYFASVAAPKRAPDNPSEETLAEEFDAARRAVGRPTAAEEAKAKYDG